MIVGWHSRGAVLRWLKISIGRPICPELSHLFFRAKVIFILICHIYLYAGMVIALTICVPNLFSFLLGMKVAL